MPYEVKITDIGQGENQILSYIQKNENCDPETALRFLEKLPIVIRKTNSKMEAYLIQEAIKSFGATVEIIQTDSIDNDEESYTNATNVRNTEEEAEFYGKGPVNMWPVHNRIRGDKEGPVKAPSGCMSIILAGFLLFVTSIILASIIVS